MGSKTRFHRFRHKTFLSNSLPNIFIDFHKTGLKLFNIILVYFRNPKILIPEPKQDYYRLRKTFRRSRYISYGKG